MEKYPLKKEPFIRMLSLFHDGKITNIFKDKDLKNITFFVIYIPYLAEMIDETYSFFTLKLVDCNFLSFTLWSDPHNPMFNVDHIQKFISQMGISHVRDDEIDEYITLRFISDLPFMGNEQIAPGGDLKLHAQSIELFDERGCEVPLEIIEELSSSF
ncbi:hypothetical protein [Tengunoibacter tsumagoiensis]|uniref:Uncharacterized protein n=1 Tax=Tengunoibacter tsumagoiensis TaxID=2014871 RepID=A0A402A4P8_9CHLR|nr:hypothetical protein [Tengunoibacter tsumagoiensis]GCE14134.1 hypothetical protein KTT_39930 [Tengunoibacter tsumagoiensis]